MQSKNLKNKKAFSLIELSIVILIVGIIVAGVTQSSRLIGAFRLSTARNQTQSSPVNSIKDLVVWWETTSQNSFLEAEADNNNPITTWYDINPQATIKKTIGQTGSARPTYVSSGINNLPTLSFNGSTKYFETAYDADLNPAEFTIFTVVMPSTVGALHGAIISSRNDPPKAGYIIYVTPSSNYEFWLGTSTNWFGDSVNNTAATVNKAVVLTASYAASGSNNQIFYKNTTTIGAISTTMNINTVRNTRIGAGANETTATVFFNGQIGEVIIYSRVLKAEERQAIQNYLIKKWNIT